MENDNCIAITHFINPHLFWFKTIEAPDHRLQILTLLEDSLLELYKSKPSSDNFLRPHIGDKVAVNYIAWNKYIRAEILQKAEYQQEHYIVWALDYGFPLLTKKEYIRNLPNKLQIDIGNVKVGGISNICPAEQEYDDMEGNLVMVRKENWLQKACDMLEKLLADSNSISFNNAFQSENGNEWGDLIIVNHKGVTINARDYLLKTTNALQVDELTFKETCSKLKTTKIAKWLSNDRNNKMKINNIKHNYIEYSKQMNATLVDENAKRKVEDWQKRNEITKTETATDMLEEAILNVPEDNIDDVTFDDSVSVTHSKETNYIRKAGILTKIRQQKYSSEKDLPPLASPEFFEISDMQLDLNLGSEPQHSSHSISTVYSKVDKLLHLNIQEDVVEGLLEEKHSIIADNSLNIPKHAGLLIELDSIASSKVSGVKRQQQLLEMRKKLAHAQKERENGSMMWNPMHNLNETTNSAVSQEKSSNSYPYQLLDQSLSLSTDNRSIAKVHIKDNKSELSVNNPRVKQLIAMRKKSSLISPSNDNRTVNTRGPTFPTAERDTGIYKNVTNFINSSNFELKPKAIPNLEDKNTHLNQMSSTSSSSKNTVNENLKHSQSGYDSFTLVPAGFDITRLQTYRNEKDHWHRKKSTRYDYVPHEQTTSTAEILSNTTNDKSFSSDLFQMKSFEATSVDNICNNSNIEQNSKAINSQQHNLNKNYNGEIHDGNNMLSEISASSNFPTPQKFRKRRQLKSPTSQLLKIDKILMEHNIEKQSGNINIMDLKLLNTSSSSQKSLMSTTEPNISCSNRNISIKDQSSSENNNSNVCSQSSTLGNDPSKGIPNHEILLDVKHTEYLPIVEGERKMLTKFLRHLVLAHSSINLMPIENISEAPFLPEIHEEMRQMRVNKVYRIQVYSWSHVLRNNSLFVVNPARSGKTWSYLPPLCSLLCSRKDSFKPSYGPVAIILVASLKHVELINNYCRRLMSGFKSEAPACVPSYGLRNLIETKIQLLNGCAVLIATPSNILRLFSENETEPLFDEERLQHIVIDDIDIMMSRSQQDFKRACSILFKMGKNSKIKKLSPQLIVTSRDWDGLMVKLIRNSNQPLLLMGDFLEAAVYGHATLSIKLKSNAEKNETILKFIKEMTQSAQGYNSRTLILCNEDEDVQHVCKLLQDYGYPSLGYYSRSIQSERAAVDEWKNKVSSQILVCTDTQFCELEIQNVNNLVHYSLPASWTQFTLRFSAFARTYNNYVCCFEHNIFTTSIAATKNCAHSLILLDENNNLQLPRLVDFMHKHNQVVQKEIQAVSKRVLIMREEQRILNTSPLCPQLLEFGECDEVRCDNRHVLTRFDIIKKNMGIPRSGDIRIRVLKVFSPTHYTVRLLHHRPANTKNWMEIRRSSEAVTFSMQLNMHYNNNNNLFLHWPPHVNDLCIYQYAENYRRARILEAPTFEKRNTNVVQSNLKVILKLIDDGIIISSVKCSEIFVCDDQFKNFPPQAVDVRLMKVVPFDNEHTWDSKTTKQVHKWIIEEMQPNYIVQANIEFSLANTIWVDCLVVLEKLTGIGAYRSVVDLKKTLVMKNFAVLYNENRKHVRDLAEEYNLLNSTEIDNDDSSDIDYESCQNESINLIRFSSSNDEATNSSMESAENSLEQNRIINSQDIKDTKSGEEDWDENLHTGHQHDEVYIPVETTTNNLEHCNANISPKKETWSELPLNELVKVEIGDEGENGNWENIFLQVINKNSMILFEDLKDLINRHVENVKSQSGDQKKTYDFKPLHNCIVKYNNLYLRAKVYGVYGENTEQRLYRFFLCDYACFTNVKSEELYNDFLYETTEEIVNFTPYQAIHCTLAGIKWDHFTKRYQVTKDYLYACAVLESYPNENCGLNLHGLRIKSYKILLYECENENEFSGALLLNKALVDNGITIYDEETKIFLEYEIGVQDKRHCNSSNNNNVKETVVPKTYNVDEVLTYEQLIDVIQSNTFDMELDDMFIDKRQSEMKCVQNNNTKKIECQDITLKSEKNLKVVQKVKKDITKVIAEKSKVPASDSEIDEQGHCTSYSNSSLKSSISLISTDISNCSESGSSLPPPPALKAIYKRPQTTWYQNDCMIFISIYAPDVKEYILEVTSKTILFAADIKSEESVLILHLLGSIDTKNVSHELKGLNVVIRLKKIVFLKWPRLLKESKKYVWLKYNFNAYDSAEMESVLPQQLLHTMINNELNRESQQSDNYNSDDDNERELYQTYNPIQCEDDDCDPFSEL